MTKVLLLLLWTTLAAAQFGAPININTLPSVGSINTLPQGGGSSFFTCFNAGQFCGNNRIIDPNTCQCVCIQSACNSFQSFNPSTCECECRFVQATVEREIPGVTGLPGVIRVRTGRGRTRGTGRGRTRGTGRGRTRGIRIGPRTAGRFIIQNPASIGPPGVIRVGTGRGRTRGIRIRTPGRRTAGRRGTRRIRIRTPGRRTAGRFIIQNPASIGPPGVIRVRTGRGRTRGTGRGRTRGTGRGRTRGIRIGPRTAGRFIIQNPASIGPPGVIRVRTGRGRTSRIQILTPIGTSGTIPIQISKRSVPEEIKGPEVDEAVLRREKRQRSRRPGTRGRTPVFIFAPTTPGTLGTSTIITETQILQSCPVGTFLDSTSCRCL